MREFHSSSLPYNHDGLLRVLTWQLEKIRGPALANARMSAEIQRTHILVSNIGHVGALAVTGAASRRQIGCNATERSAVSRESQRDPANSRRQATFKRFRQRVNRIAMRYRTSSNIFATHSPIRIVDYA